MSEHFVIVGAGQAGVQAAATLRQKGFDGQLTLIGDEPYHPYQRPPLSKKFLAGELSIERLLIRPPRFFADKDINLLLNTRVQALELQTRRLLLGDGRTLGYDKLLLALGSRPRRLAVPGHDLSGIHYLRNIDDVVAIRRDLQPGRQLVVVGGGYIGLEVAAIAIQLGLQVTVIEALDRLMARVVSPVVSRFYQQRHEAAGVTVRCDTPVAAFTGGKKVSGVRTAGGAEFPCDLVIAGIGVAPETRLAASAGLACDNGISVDELARTTNPRVFAAGDCTSHPNAALGRRIRLESVQNASDQAKAAALNMLGASTAYTELPWFWSDQYDLKLQIAGLARSDCQQVIRGEVREGSFAVLHLADGRLLATEAVNRSRAFIASKKLIVAGVSVDPAALAATDRSLADVAREALSHKP